MNGKPVIKYDLLLSCPSDLKDYKSAVNDVIEMFNSEHGVGEGVSVALKYWSTSTYPDSSRTMQDGINDQAVKDCSFGVALFGNRFGTPTKKFGSGTEEEIHLLMSSQKQVFIYFIHGPSSEPTDQKQREKVEEFKAGLSCGYRDINGKEEFIQFFHHDLTLYMLRQTEVGGEAPFAQKQSRLRLLSVYSDKSGAAVIQHRSFKNSPLLKGLYSEIVGAFASLKEPLPLKPKPVPPDLSTPIGRALASISATPIPSFRDPIFIKEEDKEIIRKFAKENNLAIDETVFWDLGDLSRNILTVDFSDKSLVGTPKEIARYKLLSPLAETISKFNEYSEYFESFEGRPYCVLALANDGTMPDSDIDIVLKLPKDSYSDPLSFPYPRASIIDEVVDKGFLSALISEPSKHDLLRYSDYPALKAVNEPPSFAEFSADNESFYRRAWNRYQCHLDSLLAYSASDEDDGFYLTFHFSYLKQHNTMLFPCYLFFAQPPQEISYSITSKELPNVVKGTLAISDVQQSQ